MADLTALRELYAWMREERVEYARCGDLELKLAPPQLQVVPVGGVNNVDPDASDREALETLLYSSGVDAGALFDAIKAAEAKA